MRSSGLDVCIGCCFTKSMKARVESKIGGSRACRPWKVSRFNTDAGDAKYAMFGRVEFGTEM